jgi:hypothetical protein
MAANAPPLMVPPGGAPPVVAPQLPLGADPGRITGWILDKTTAATPTSITQELEQGFNHLVNNIPATNDANYHKVMQEMTDEVMYSGTLTTYLTATNRWNNVVRVTTLHSIAK